MLRVDETGNSLKVIDIDFNHNHVLNEHLFNHLPHQRQLSDEIKEEAKRFLKVKGNRSIIQHELQKQSSQIITLKDLSNLAMTLRKEQKNNLESVCWSINTKYGMYCIKLFTPLFFLIL